jgi:hypothetical protein
MSGPDAWRNAQDPPDQAASRGEGHLPHLPTAVQLHTAIVLAVATALARTKPDGKPGSVQQHQTRSAGATSSTAGDNESHGSAASALLPASE